MLSPTVNALWQLPLLLMLFPMGINMKWLKPEESFRQREYWPPLMEAPKLHFPVTQIQPPTTTAFVQEENSPAAWSVSYTGPGEEDGRARRPHQRYIFQGVRFARPPDPQAVWQEQLKQLQQAEGQLIPLGMKPPEIPQAIRNYFSLDAPPEKVVRELTGVDLHSLLGPHFDQLLVEATTASPSWTRPTTPKDKLVQYFERSLDHFLSGRFRPMERIPYPLEEDKLLEATTMNATMAPAAKNENQKDDADLLEGSGEAPDDEELNKQIQQQQQTTSSSITGIPSRMPLIPKVPVDFIARQEDPPAEFVSKIIEMNARRALEEGALVEGVAQRLRKEFAHHRRTEHSFPEATKMAADTILEEPPAAARELLMAKTIKKDFQYGAKPSYQQGVMSTLLHFLGINSPQGGTELDQALTEWIMEHSPRHQSKHEKRAYEGESSYARMQKFLSSPLTPLCTPQPEVMDNFEVDAFMGQWFEVMYSPLMSTSTCTVLSYRMLGPSSFSGGVGALFQTLHYASPQRPPPSSEEDNNAAGAILRWEGISETSATPATSTIPQQEQQQPQLTSGYAMVSRPGQIIFKRSKSAEEVTVHIIDAGGNNHSTTAGGRYEYAILGINCNYPLYVIARDPYTFNQKYEQYVMKTLERKGLINDFSRLLNIVTPVNPTHCQMPTHFFDWPTTSIGH